MSESICSAFTSKKLKIKVDETVSVSVQGTGLEVQTNNK